MHSVSHLEEIFQRLQTHLSFSSSVRRSLCEISTFLSSFEDLDSGYEIYKSYLLELSDILPSEILLSETVGLSPVFFEELAIRLTKGADLISPDPASNKYVRLKDQCESVASFHYCLVGDFKKGVGFDGELLEDRERIGQISPFERIQLLSQQNGSLPSDSLTKIDTFLEEWGRLRGAEGTFGYFPVVEQIVLGNGEKYSVPGLRSVRVQILNRRDSADHFHVDTTIVGHPESKESLLSRPLSAARFFLQATHPQLAVLFFEGRVTFGNRMDMHTGHSVNIVLALLLYAEILRFAEQRLQYRITSGTLFTGDIDETGRLISVDEHLLRFKVEAAFHSTAELLVVPVDQKHAAWQYAKDLTHEFPEKNLEILGISTLRELFFDRRLIFDDRIGLVRHAGQYVWRRRYKAGSLVGLIAIIIALVLVLSVDNNPVYTEVDESGILVYNERGRLLERLPVGDRSLSLFSNFGTGLVDLVDLDGDKENEIIWAVNSDLNSGETAWIRCKKVGKDEPEWERQFILPVDYPGHPEVTSSRFDIVTMIIEDFDQDGSHEIALLLGHQEYFPGILMLLDATTGELRGRWDHAGVLFDMTSVDLNDDGRTELVLAGTNNSYNRGIAVVLDPNSVSGFGPSTPDYMIRDAEPGSEMYYLRLPVSNLGRAFPPYIYYAHTVRTSLYEHTVNIHVSDVSGATLVDPGDRPSYILTLGYDMTPLSVGTNSWYDRVLEYLQDTIGYEGTFSRAAKDSLLREIEYWDGESWSHEPVMNSHYLEVRDLQTDTSRN